MNFQVQNTFYHGWNARSNTGADGKPILLSTRLPILHDAVIAACDELDGQKDGLISYPPACSFDVGSIQCAANVSDTSTCLTAEEVDVVRKIYQGPVDVKSGTPLIAGPPQYGSELAWGKVFAPATADAPIFSGMIALQDLQLLAFKTNPPTGYALSDLQFDLATFDQLKALHPLYDATNPDLSAFAGSDGKLILYHGWEDTDVSPINTITYFNAVEGQLGAQKVQSFARLYLFPGMEHCSGGDGPYEFDMLTPMMRWVEQDQAPDAIVARQPAADASSNFGQARQTGQTTAATTLPGYPTPTSVSTDTVRSRPVYPYPATTQFTGSGDPNDAANYQKGPELPHFDAPKWAGAEFFKPYAPLIL